MASRACLRAVVRAAGTVLAAWLLTSCGGSGLHGGPAAGEPSTLYLNTARIRGFDPVKVNDLASGMCVMRVYECLLQHSYLERPFKLEPLLCTSMPEVSPDGLVYTFHLRKGIFFQDDPCFPGGKGREMTAEDFVYSFKRIANGKNASVAWWIFEGKIKGMDAYHESSGRREGEGEAPEDYLPEIEGLRATDRHTLQIVLNQPYAQLLWVLAMHHCVVVPREAVEKYGKAFSTHPVGTGPYVLRDWVQNYRIEFVRSPKWGETGRIDRYPSAGEPGDAEQGLLADAGKPLPLCDRIVNFVVMDSTTEWLMFLKGQFDEIRSISRDNWTEVVDENRALLPALADRGIQLHSGPAMDVGYIGFNMDDPVLGKNAKLRQAMHCAFNHDEWIKLNNYRIKKPTGPIPEGVPGYPAQPLPYSFDLDRAKKLLAEAGFPEGKDAATGRRLEVTIDVGSADSPDTRMSIEKFVDFMAKIDIKVTPSYNNWPTFLEKLERRQVQMFYLRWLADYPDAQNFLLLFHGKSVSPGPNHSNYINPAFDALYDRALGMQDTPERTAIYERLAGIVREDCPWIFHSDNISFILRQPWTYNYKFHPFAVGTEKYCRVDEANRGRVTRPAAKAGGR